MSLLMITAVRFNDNCESLLFALFLIEFAYSVIFFNLCVFNINRQTDFILIFIKL
jgi:hypothetical protein